MNNPNVKELDKRKVPTMQSDNLTEHVCYVFAGVSSKLRGLQRDAVCCLQWPSVGGWYLLQMDNFSWRSVIFNRNLKALLGLWKWLSNILIFMYFSVHNPSQSCPILAFLMYRWSAFLPLFVSDHSGEPLLSKYCCGITKWTKCSKFACLRTSK